MRIGLVACSATKLPQAAPAQELYASDLFRKAAAYASRNYDRWMILSAQHHLVDPEQWLAPYDLTLTRLARCDRRLWGHHVALQLAARGFDRPGVTFFFHAGEAYRQELVYRLRARVVVPLEGLRIGEQLAWYVARA